MSTNPNDAAYARPLSSLSPEEWLEASDGLTKRELFAAMALQGFAANPVLFERVYEGQINRDRGGLAALSVSAADSLIAVLNHAQEEEGKHDDAQRRTG